MFKDNMVEKPKSLYANIETFNIESGKVIYEVNSEYIKSVRTKSKFEDEAALLWLKENNAITAADIEKYHELRVARNDIVHNMVDYLASSEKNFDETLLADLISLFNKIEKWWFSYFELSINPDIIPEGTDPDDVIPGTMITVKLMIEIALGAEPSEGFYFNEFIKRKK